MMIEIDNISKSYKRGPDEIVALRQVSLRVEQGEFVAFMGPSGSGKSTLLNLIAGLDKPDVGRILVEGASLDAMSDSALAAMRARRIGIVFQSFNLVPVLSAQENVELPLLLRSLSRAERRKRATTALEVVGLPDRARHRPNELSGGEQQRVAIARAIVTDPDIVVADEPTGDLDAANAEGILALLRELCRSMEKTVLMVTHDARAEKFVDRTAYLDKGVLEDSTRRQRGAA